MDTELTPQQAARAQKCLQEMAAAIEGVARSTGAEDRRSFWFTYEENQASLHELVPLVGDPVADEGPYTSET